MNKWRIGHVVLALLLYTSATAQVEGNPQNWCRNGFFTTDAAGFRPGKVVGAKGARVHFYGEEENDCPAAGAKCRKRSYLVSGDSVVVSREFAGYTCAWFAPRKGRETVGWLPSKSLVASKTDEAPQPAAWIGEWEYGIQSLDITRGKRLGTLAVKGEAYWRGLGDNVHTGDVDFEAAAKGNVLELEENEDLCSITIRLIGEFLVVSDNLKCGGVNVTFNGVYRKK